MYQQNPLDAVQEVMSRLRAAGLETVDYTLSDYDGYEPVIPGSKADLYGLEARLGASPGLPGVSSWAIAHLPDPDWRNLAFISMVEKDDATGAPITSRVPVYDQVIDHVLSYTFLPLMFTAWTCLDPKGKNQGMLVQAYQARVTLGNLPSTTIATIKLMRRFKRDGQLAQVAVDFDDPLIRIVAKLVSTAMSHLNLHFLPKTPMLSLVRVPVSNGRGGYHDLKQHSKAVDAGFEIARRYLSER